MTTTVTLAESALAESPLRHAGQAVGSGMIHTGSVDIAPTSVEGAACAVVKARTGLDSLRRWPAMTTTVALAEPALTEPTLGNAR